jgi:hypothetical protein
MTDSRKLSVRLDAAQSAQLQKFCVDSGVDWSTAARRALAALFGGPPNVTGPTTSPADSAVDRTISATSRTLATASDCVAPTAVINGPAHSNVGTSVLSQRPPGTAKATAPSHPRRWRLTAPVPASLADLVSEARGLGMSLRKARRLQFQRCVAATAVAMESAEDLRESELYDELARIGALFNLLS